MKASDHLNHPPRSSPRPRRQAPGANTSTVESPLSKISQKNPSTTGTNLLPVGDSLEKGTPTRSHKRMKIEAVNGTAKPLSPAAETNPSKQNFQIPTKQEEQEEEEARGARITDKVVKKTSRKREVDEKEEINETQANGRAPQSSKRKKPTRIDEVEAEVSEPSAKRTKRKQIEVNKEEEADSEASPAKRMRKTKVEEEEGKLEENGEAIKKITRKRKTKEEKEAEAMPIAARSNGLRMFIGAHVSCAKGVHNTVTNCVHIGGNAFAMFLKSQRKWENPPLQNEHKDLFISNCNDHKYDASSHVLPHGSYLVNLAQEDPEKATQAYDAFLDDLQRCEALGIKLYNFHPGSTGSHPRPSAIARIAKALNRAHLATKTVTPVLETMAAGGNVIGSTFEDLRDIIALIDDKKRIGVCLDTCHVFAAGYDLRSPTAFKKTLDDFDKIVGMKYLRALHLNDSKAPFDSHRDLHQNIGLGFLGLRAFHNVMNETRFEGLPLVLETPIDHKDPATGKDVEDKGVWAREIKMLEGLIGTDADSEDFKALEKDLADKGAEERKKLQEQYDKKVEKDRKALEKGQTRLSFGKQKKKNGESGQASDSEA